jgi:hypothetical protein
LADMPVKAPMKPIIVQPYNWTGFYLGIAGGGGWADTRHTNTINGINSGTVGISGGLFGGTYGYNFQLGSWCLASRAIFHGAASGANFLTTTEATSALPP